ncbi:phosphotransferase [Cumulibacter soli]|uniref:phosphotransferase n=1 Tax=Cumulibacter soli TaxID=2546344 RepID=UPI0010685194|nr:phosphotransferase [Cumulibacter soli]
MTTQRTPRSVPGRHSADLLIDQDKLSALVGHQVRAVHLRHKPGLSTRAALIDPASEHPPRWVHVVYPAHTDKLRNALRRRRSRDQFWAREVPRTIAGEQLLLAYGEIDTDPRLQRGLNTVRDTDESVSSRISTGELAVLRYNPQRRLVLRREIPGTDPLVVRITARPQNGVHHVLAHLSDAGVPLIQPLAQPAHRYVTLWPWYGTGDLEQVAPAESAPYAAAAGRALAALHAAGASGGLNPVLTVSGELSAVAEDLARIDPEAGQRMRKLADATIARIDARTWRTGVVHGDFSADQVLLEDETTRRAPAVALTDFDRAGIGPLAMDLGTFAATELLAVSAPGNEAFNIDTLPRTTALAAGYSASSDGVHREWVARALLSRVMEPFRAGDPNWASAIERRLDQVAKVLA